MNSHLALKTLCGWTTSSAPRDFPGLTSYSPPLTMLQPHGSLLLLQAPPAPSAVPSHVLFCRVARRPVPHSASLPRGPLVSEVFPGHPTAASSALRPPCSASGQGASPHLPCPVCYWFVYRPPPPRGGPP